MGRCRRCHESYKIVFVFVKTGTKPKTHMEPRTETSLPSWQTPSDTSIFGGAVENAESTFSNVSFSWDSESREKESGTGSEQ